MLIQLPEKEAGAGLAFGGGATDALFGAGSGNVLTKITKDAAVILFVLALMLSIMESKYFNRSGSAFRRGLQEQQSHPGGGLPAAIPDNVPASTPVPQTSAPTTTSGSNLNLMIPQAEAGGASNSAPAQQK